MSAAGRTWQAETMAKISTHTMGTPVWADLNVETTEDRERLMGFFTALFGWSWDVNGPDMGHYSIATHDGAAVMGIGQGPGGAGVPTVYFGVRDIAAAVSLATAAGGTEVMGPMEVPETGHMAIVLDPTGAPLGLWQATNFKGFGAMYEPNAPGWFDHASSDYVTAAWYYSTLTGHATRNIGAGGLVLVDGENMFASLSPQAPGMPGGWSPIFVVESLERTRAVAIEQGATVVVEEQEVPGSAISVLLEPVTRHAVTVMRAGAQP